MAITFNTLNPDAKIFQELKKNPYWDSKRTLPFILKYARTTRSMCISREEVLLEYTIVASIRNYRCLHIINTLTFQLRQRVMPILNVATLLISR